MHELGVEVARSTIQRILRDNGIEPDAGNGLAPGMRVAAGAAHQLSGSPVSSEPALRAAPSRAPDPAIGSVNFDMPSSRSSGQLGFLLARRGAADQCA